METLSSSSPTETGNSDHFTALGSEAEVSSSCHISLAIPNAHHIQVIHRVPPQFRNNKKPSPYDPVIVSIGPYHHAKPELRHAEKFKQHAVKAFVLESGHSDKSYFYGKILEHVHDIRACYDDEVMYGNQALAKLIFRDACFFIHQMKVLVTSDSASSDYIELARHFGQGGIKFVARDLLLVENQIPLWIIKSLIRSQSKELYDQWDSLLFKYISCVVFDDIYEHLSLNRFPWEHEPFNFLDAVSCYLKLVQVKAPSPSATGNIVDKLTAKNINLIHAKSKFIFEKKKNYQLRSIIDLKEKGVCCRRSETKIIFISYPLCGKFHLTPLILTNNLLVLYSNLIAHELSPTSNSDFLVSSYVNFMKSLIQTIDDVKELREQGILVGNIGNDEEVVRVFKELDTFGIDNSNTFLELKASFDKHCSNIAKTWKAELICTYFRSPFTVIALFATSFLLSLTTIQTFYAMHPSK